MSKSPRCLYDSAIEAFIEKEKQALHYQQNILNYVDVADTPKSQLNGYAYCYNYKYTGKPNDLYAEQYKPVIEKCPLNGGDQVVAFAEVLDKLLSGGRGKEVFREFTSCQKTAVRSMAWRYPSCFRQSRYGDMKR